MKTKIAFGVLFLFSTLATAPAFGQDRQLPGSQVQSEVYGEQLGTVRFPVSCTEEAQQHAERGLALLHHMTYEGGRAAFEQAAAADPECSMGYWGQAMSYIHPLWSDPPTAEGFERARNLVAEAKARGPKTDWEQAFIAAVDAYFKPGRGASEAPNLAAFEEGWQAAYEQFPDNPEAVTFYALAHLATADPADKTYAVQRQAAELAGEVLARMPNHPGAQHYTIHAYDYPPLAEEALDVARSYGEIAPAVPHSLHMPSHIFTRLGLWPESIAMNRRSAEAALKHPAEDKISMHYLHALDYLAYAYLQRAEDDRAREVLETIGGLTTPIQPHVGTAYALAGVPARYALERQEWAQAAALEPRVPDTYPWDQFPALEAITYFARALGAARSGKVEEARQALATMAELQKQAAAASEYWANQVAIQRLAAAAWLAYEEGRQDEGLKLMRQAAAQEAATEKHPVTPGEVLPARELLADMLLASGRYQEAEDAYLAALARSPNRFNSLYGAGRAAELAGNPTQAAFYYRKLVEITAADAQRERLQKARTFLAQE